MNYNIHEFRMAPIGSIVSRDLCCDSAISQFAGLLHVAIKISHNEVIDFTTEGCKKRSVYAFFAPGTIWRGTKWGGLNTTPWMTAKWAIYAEQLARRGLFEWKYNILGCNCQYFCIACIYGAIRPYTIRIQDSYLPPIIEWITMQYVRD